MLEFIGTPNFYISLSMHFHFQLNFNFYLDVEIEDWFLVDRKNDNMLMTSSYTCEIRESN